MKAQTELFAGGRKVTDLITLRKMCKEYFGIKVLTISLQSMKHDRRRGISFSGPSDTYTVRESGGVGPVLAPGGTWSRRHRRRRSYPPWHRWPAADRSPPPAHATSTKTEKRLKQRQLQDKVRLDYVSDQQRGRSV